MDSENKHCYKCQGNGRPQRGDGLLVCDWCDGKGFLTPVDYARLVPQPDKWCAVPGKKQKKRHFGRAYQHMSNTAPILPKRSN